LILKPISKPTGGLLAAAAKNHARERQAAHQQEGDATRLRHGSVNANSDRAVIANLTPVARWKVEVVLKGSVSEVAKRGGYAACAGTNCESGGAHAATDDGGKPGDVLKACAGVTLPVKRYAKI